VNRIAVQLLDTQTGRHDVTAETLFTLQDQIAEEIASALKISVDRSPVTRGPAGASVQPGDLRLLVHAAMRRAYLGDGESALALGTKAMRLNPRFPPYYTAPVGLALFVLGRDAEALALGSQAPISMFVDIPAFLAASCALTGDVERAVLSGSVPVATRRSHHLRTSAGSGRTDAVAVARESFQADAGQRSPRARSASRGA
jgi:hypothetical protein